MPRVYLPSITEDEPVVTIKGESARYLLSVLRVRKGSEIVLFDSGGRRFRAEVLKRTGNTVHVGIRGSLDPLPEPRTGVILLQGLLKGRKMDLVVQKATELWVREIVPVITERSQVRETRKLERWRKIALEASRQCGRAALPAVREPIGLIEFLDSLGPGAEGRERRGYIFCEEGGEELGRDIPVLEDEVVAAVGPEGGFTDEEVWKARGKGLKPVTLGGPTLRAETAAISAVTLIQYLLGNM
jgi:16S rRNA (uracil1498-N3)-methyltransferase